MKKILITGATGNIGVEVIAFLKSTKQQVKVIAAVRDIQKSQKEFADFPELDFVHFDFEQTGTFETAFDGIDLVFMLRPPHISEIDRYFRPFISKMTEKKVKEVLFLSVQGADKSKVIPHNKIEKLIRESGLEYIFLRPAYFMQNLTTTLLPGIKAKRKIILPAGKGKFNWIDIKNIAEAGALLLGQFSEYKNRAIDITGYENENYYKVAELLNGELTTPIEYESVNPLKFYRIKKREGMASGMILVMLMLHLLPRFQKEPEISTFYEQLTGKKPTTLVEFIQREKEILEA